MQKLRQEKAVRNFVWTLFNALISLLVIYLTNDAKYVVLVPVLNMITKEINLRYFNDLGVE